MIVSPGGKKPIRGQPVSRSTKHVDDRQLTELLWQEEESYEVRTVAEHVAECAECRTRLEELSGTRGLDHETREMLRYYPWEECAEFEVCEMPHIGSRPTCETDFLRPAGHPELLGRLGRYDVEGIIGSGGMGVVLKAHDAELNRPVALKVLANHLAHSGAAKQRFARESRAVAAVVHEHVVAIHNVEVDGDAPFLVMQYVAGESLQTRVDRQGPLDVAEILRIGIQVASGLAAAHEQGVVHRDVKPGNILLEKGVERALLSDFGLARTVDDANLTQTGVIAGTPHYMSPEQAGGQSTDYRTDLFSLGAVLYFMATGHPPFRAERAMGVLHRICNDRQKPLWQIRGDLPDRLSVLVDRLLAKQPAKRISSAKSTRDQLVKVLAQLQQPEIRPIRRIRRVLLRYPWRAIVAVMVVVLAGFLLFDLGSMPTTESGAQQAIEHKGAPNPSGGSEAMVVLPSAESVALPTHSEVEKDLGKIRERLLRLMESAYTSGPIDVPQESSLQSLRLRLERLQSNYDFQSPQNVIGELP